MLGDLSGVAKIFLVAGYTDMRRSIDGLIIPFFFSAEKDATD